MENIQTHTYCSTQLRRDARLHAWYLAYSWYRQHGTHAQQETPEGSGWTSTKKACLNLGVKLCKVYLLMSLSLYIACSIVTELWMQMWS